MWYFSATIPSTAEQMRALDFDVSIDSGVSNSTCVAQTVHNSGAGLVTENLYVSVLPHAAWNNQNILMLYIISPSIKWYIYFYRWTNHYDMKSIYQPLLTISIVFDYTLSISFVNKKHKYTANSINQSTESTTRSMYYWKLL